MPEDSLMRELREEHEDLQRYHQEQRRRQPRAACAEPHHARQHDEKAHRAHHWKERLICLAFCGSVHALWEIGVHVFGHAH